MPIFRSSHETRFATSFRSMLRRLPRRPCTSQARAIAGNPHPNADLARSPATGKLPFATALSPISRLPARVRHPYQARSIRKTIHDPESTDRKQVLSKASHLPDPTLRPRKDAETHNSELRIVNFESVRRRGDFEYALFVPSGERTTSWLSSRPGSNPWRPSRGTGYG